MRAFTPTSRWQLKKTVHQTRATSQALQASSETVSYSKTKADAKRIATRERASAQGPGFGRDRRVIGTQKKAALYFGAEEEDDILNQSER